MIPGAVIRQLDYLKNSNDESVAWCSRKASQSIEKYQRRNRVKIMGNMGDGLVDMLHSGADNQIVATGRYLKGQGHNVCLLSTDRNMRIAARKYGMTAETGDDREILEKIWTFITCVVFSVPMLALIAPSILPLFITMPDLNASPIKQILGIIVLLGFLITIIPLSITVYYGNRSRPRQIRDDDNNNTSTSPEFYACRGNLYYNIYHHSDNDR